MQLAVNKIPDEIGLADTLREMVQEALFYMGVVKVGLSTAGTVMGKEYGESFVDLVSGDDYFIDMSAKHRREISYEGNQYWVDYEKVKKSGWLEGTELRDINPDEYTTIGIAGERRAESLTAASSAVQYRERLWLRDIWLPDENCLVTATMKSKKFVKAVDWKGPEGGPYINLGFCPVPGNVLPLPPVSLWRDLHELSNTVFRKLGKQAESQKTVQAFSGSDDQGAQAFKEAKDGDGIKYNGSAPTEMKTGGVDSKGLAFYLQCRDLSSYFCGNLDSLGGLSQQAATLGQDKLLSEAASAQMSDMADKTLSAVKKIFNALAFYEWTDPVKKRTLQKPIPGTGFTIPVEFNADQKIGDWKDYKPDVDIYSLQDNSPGVRMQKLNLFVEKYIIPLQPQIQAIGGSIDIQKIFELAARYSDFKELGELVHFAESMNVGAQQPQQSSGMPSSTSRTYTRVGQPGMSREGSTAALMQQLLSSKGEQ
jgi:hypothetical protein